MADVEKSVAREAVHSPNDSPTQSLEGGAVDIPKGWKYKNLKIGPFTLPWYASPEAQLILVAVVCFLCPGRYNSVALDNRND